MHHGSQTDNIFNSMPSDFSLISRTHGLIFFSQDIKQLPPLKLQTAKAHHACSTSLYIDAVYPQIARGSLLRPRLDSESDPGFPVSEVLAADTISDTALPRQVYQIPEDTTRQLFVTIWEES